MSILKRLFLDDVLPLLWRKPERTQARLATRSANPQIRAASVGDSGPLGGPATGVRVVILNWNAGENDPFSVTNRAIRSHFHACGKNVDVIEITSKDWVDQLTESARDAVEFAFTWQGIGSPTRTSDGSESIWDRLRIPLICLHGDHPSHMPRNHSLESRYCFHLYTNAEFARYSNRHFRRLRSASIIDVPQLDCEMARGTIAGDYFVVAKNITHPADTEEAWRARMDKNAFAVFMSAAETLKHLVTHERYVEVHEVLDELIAERSLEWLTPTANIDTYHHYHSQLDLYVRNFKSVAAVTSISDFPLRVYGRGWERVAKGAPALHKFGPAQNKADSQGLYYSRFGLIDISPSKGLHDRTRRAMANKTGFLSSANLEDSFPDIDNFSPLFFSFGTDALAEKCAAVARDPDEHRGVAARFAEAYHTRFHFKQFVSRLEQLAALARGVERPAQFNA
jgi:hypothetical protein